MTAPSGGATSATPSEVSNVPCSSNTTAGATESGTNNQSISQSSQPGNVTQTPADGSGNANTGQEAERGAAGGDGNIGSSEQNQATATDSQLSLRRGSGSSWSGPSPAVTAFEAAKDIMEALRTKHSNLATELEVSDAVPMR